MKLHSAVAAVSLTLAFSVLARAQAPIVREPPAPAPLTNPGYAPPAAAEPPPSPEPPAPYNGPLPPAAAEALAQLTSQPATHSSFTLDRDLLQGMLGHQAADLHSVTVTNYRFHEPAFYVPEELAAMRQAYALAGWKHLIEQHVSPRQEASPTQPVTDLWLHYHGTVIDDVAVLVRAPREMAMIEVAGTLRPLDLVHLGGHFGIPRVDPGAVMVPAPPGR